MGKFWAHILISTFLGSAVVFAEDDAVAPPSIEIVISVAEQKLALVKDGGLLRKYPISTSKFGLGDAYNSYKTPLGRLRVCDKIGDHLAQGAVLKSRNATGEILQVNAPGRDPIVTRILWLDGLESCNSNARSRGIYIHGTVEESRLGQPVSYGCIRMRSRDVVELFEATPIGTPVEIITDRFPRFRKAEPRPEILFASKDGVRAVFGPRGMVSVQTVRATQPNPAAMNAPEMLTAKSPEQTSKPAPASARLAAVPAPAAPVEDGPTVVLKTVSPQPNVVLSLKTSILTAGLPKSPETAPAPAPQMVVNPAAPRNLVLQMVAAAGFLAAEEMAQDEKPLDRLSAHLLSPPAPTFRLAFRTTAEPPEL